MIGPFGLLFAVLVLAVGGGLVLYALIRAETEREEMDRASAERAARRDRD